MNNNDLKEKAKDFMDDFEEQCRKEKESRYEEDNYFDTFKDNYGIISYDEENEDVERIPYTKEDSSKKIICFVFIAIGMFLLTICSLLALTSPWGNYGSKRKFILYFFFGCGGFIYSLYQIVKIIRNSNKQL